jgi:hypothetical protein
MAVGHTFKRVEEISFDWVFAGVVTAWATATYGFVWGSVVTFCILAPAAGIISYLEILFYDWAKKDWLGIELIKEFRDEEKHEHWFGHIIHRITRMGGVPAFILLSIHGDAFITTAYFRPKHRQYHGMHARDWMIFFGSLLLSVAYWTLRWTVLIAIVAWVWVHFLQPLWSAL